MDAQLLLSAVAAGAGVAGVVVSILRLKRKFDAEHMFLNLLISDPAFAGLQALRERMVHGGIATSAEVQQLVGSLDDVARALPEDYKQLIEESLLQRSVRGRARYAEKLMDKAGIGAGSPPIAVQ
jgi:hypothetical protein